MPDHEPIEPYRDAINSVLPVELREELQKFQRQFRAELKEALAAKGRATEHIRTERLDRPFEVLEHEMEMEHADLVRYHAAKLAKKVKWLLEHWKDTPDEE